MKTQTQMQHELFSLVAPAQELSERVMVRRQPDDPVLRRRTGEIVQTTMDQELPCRYLGTMPLFDGHRVYRGQEHDWGLMQLEEDPLYQSRDGYPMPTQVGELLAQILLAGINFDAIYVAHEVEKGALVEGKPMDPLALIPPPAPSVQKRSRQLGWLADKLFKVATAPLLALTAASLALTSAGVVAAAAGAVGAAASGVVAVRLLDPVVFGVIGRTGRELGAGEMGCWFYLAHWRYGEDER
jgi:hypothetical protein